MWFFDFPTLVLIIAAGFELGIQGIFGVDAAGAIFGPHERLAFALMGFSALWQLGRQRFR